MKFKIRYHRKFVTVNLPAHAIVYEPHYPRPIANPSKVVADSLKKPICAPSLSAMLKTRKPANVVVVVSDITRPVPYKVILPSLLKEIEQSGICKSSILILIATGMHRASTKAERIEMFGQRIAREYRIIDHDGGKASGLVRLKGRSASGAEVRINRHYAEADFKIVTGLVEPHFMAGFSGGRKAICPGISSLKTLRQFHGERFLSSRHATGGNLKNNPLHREASSIAALAKVDFCINAVMDSARRLVGLFSGELTASHQAAMNFVSKYACPIVRKPADIVITGSGGYPLDATFYQCGKGFVGCLPAVKKRGVIIALGGCSEGVGSREYEGTLKKYSGKWRRFLKDIRNPRMFIKDQWQIQMQTRALAKVGQERLYFMTHGLNAALLAKLSVNAQHVKSSKKIGHKVEELLRQAYRKGMKVAVFPEGPYCAPVQPTPFPSLPKRQGGAI